MMPFECKQCGKCCRWGGWVYLTHDDITAIARRLDLTEDAFIQAHTQLAPDRQRLCLAGPEHTPCPFLENNQCAIYPVRPQQCRDYPHKWRTSTPCPGFPTQ
ncbi:MAG: YkgJ family cysteine cluster protein [Spartobacteria bacterium]|nr:YkgJ family cysteine cluster protein [Spartobacteria bacterium]